MSIETIVVIAIVGALVAWFFKNEKSEEVVEPSRTPPERDVDLEAMTKAELIAYAESAGVEVKKSWTKGKIVGEIRRVLSSFGFERG